jgi:hypothetical protein
VFGWPPTTDLCGLSSFRDDDAMIITIQPTTISGDFNATILTVPAAVRNQGLEIPMLSAQVVLVMIFGYHITHWENGSHFFCLKMKWGFKLQTLST